MNFPRPDVLIVARGGGSLEDLWGFNEECVVRAVYGSKIPVISAVGHETDTTLIDYVADLRAPTPTGAAEKAVPLRAELLRQTQDLEGRLRSGLLRSVQEKRLLMESLARALPNLNEIIPLFIQRLDDSSGRLTRAFDILMKRAGEKLSSMGRLLNSYSYQDMLKRGFALVSAGGHVVSSVAEAEKHPQMNLTFADGIIKVTPTKPKKTPLTLSAEQADLFKK